MKKGGMGPEEWRANGLLHVLPRARGCAFDGEITQIARKISK